jgi:hypothetical protein
VPTLVEEDFCENFVLREFSKKFASQERGVAGIIGEMSA